MICKELFILLFAFFNLTCFTTCNFTATKAKAKELNFEGYIIFDVTFFTDVDNRSGFQNTVKGNDSTIANRRMYLKNNFLIDIVPNEHFDNGKHIKTDTLTYDFYDLVNQKYIFFEKLLADSKIVKKGNMTADASFSNKPQYDPMNGIADSSWMLVDVVVNGKSKGIINFDLTKLTDTLEKEFAKKTKFWIDHEIKNFPLQLSYILSKKLNGSFVYKMQNPFPDGKTVMVTSLDYQPIKLSDTLSRIFERWAQIIKE